MTGRMALCLGLLVACLAAPAGATTAAKQKPAPAAATTAAKQKPAPAAAATAAKQKPAPAAATTAAKQKPAPAAAATAAKMGTAIATTGAKNETATASGLPVTAPRTLEDIHIEGEIPVPQVLFITARDQRRFTQFHHRRYLKTGLKVGEEAILPSRIALARTPPTDPGPR